MSVCPKTGEDFNVSANYNLQWNPHYDFTNPKNIAEIDKMARYDACFKAVYGGNLERDSDEYEQAAAFLQQCESAALGGKSGYDVGVEVGSAWGRNKVIGVATENGEDVVKKEITVFANNMLSLQSHNGRREEWEVQNGTLSLIMDGDLYDVSDDGVFKVTDGKKEQITDPNVAVKNGTHWTMILQPGSAHCMINRSNDDVTVIEVQRGICREADNKRFADQCRDKDPRAILPLTSEVLYKSAKIYWAVENEIASKPELRDKGWKASFTPDSAVA
jgi:hypothetical protein